MELLKHVVTDAGVQNGNIKGAIRDVQKVPDGYAFHVEWEGGAGDSVIDFAQFRKFIAEAHEETRASQLITPFVTSSIATPQHNKMSKVDGGVHDRVRKFTVTRYGARAWATLRHFYFDVGISALPMAFDGF